MRREKYKYRSIFVRAAGIIDSVPRRAPAPHRARETPAPNERRPHPPGRRERSAAGVGSTCALSAVHRMHPTRVGAGELCALTPPAGHGGTRQTHLKYGTQSGTAHVAIPLRGKGSATPPNVNASHMIPLSAHADDVPNVPNPVVAHVDHTHARTAHQSPPCLISLLVYTGETNTPHCHDSTKCLHCPAYLRVTLAVMPVLPTPPDPPCLGERSATHCTHVP